MDKDAGVPIEQEASEMSGIPLSEEEAELLPDPPEQAAEQAPHSSSPTMAVNPGSACAVGHSPVHEKYHHDLCNHVGHVRNYSRVIRAL